MKYKLLGLSTIFIILIYFVQLVGGEEKKTLIFGIVPQQSAQKLAITWTPFCNYLSRKTGYDIVFHTAPNIQEFEKRLAAGEYDLAYINPYQYVTAHQSSGYNAFARQNDTRLAGIIVVKKDSACQKLIDLKDKTVALPYSSAFAASILTRLDLEAAGVKIIPKYVISHDSVYMTVAKGIYAAGGGVIRTLKTVDPIISNQLRILWTTKSYSPHAFAAHPRISDQIVQYISAAMFNMHKDSAAKPLLEALNFNSFEPAQDSDWDDIRSLDLVLLNKLSKD